MAVWSDHDWSPHVQDVQLGGGRLRYADLGTGPPLLLVHGTGGSWTSWLLNLRELSRDFRVIAADIPGFGASTPLGPSRDLSPYADGLAALLDHLSVPAVTVVGHSLGGLVALRLTVRHPARVNALVSVDGGGVALTRHRLRAVTSFLRLTGSVMRRREVTRALVHRPRLRRLALGALMHDPSRVTGPLATELLTTFAAPGLLDAIAAGAADDAADHIDRVGVPVLLMWGRHDRILPVALAEAMVQEIRHCELVVFEHSAHCPMLEEPERFNAALAEWTGRVSAQG